MGIDLEAGSVEAMWNLARVAGLEHVFPTPNPPLVEQGWTFRPFHVSSNGRRIFGIVEAAGGLGDVETGDVYQLVELELPNMKLIQNAVLPGRGRNVPNALRALRPMPGSEKDHFTMADVCREVRQISSELLVQGDMSRRYMTNRVMRGKIRWFHHGLSRQY